MIGSLEYYRSDFRHFSNTPSIQYSITPLQWIFNHKKLKIIPLAIFPGIHPHTYTTSHSRGQDEDCELLFYILGKWELARLSRIQLIFYNGDTGLQKCRQKSSAAYPARDILVSMLILFSYIVCRTNCQFVLQLKQTQTKSTTQHRNIFCGVNSFNIVSE